MDEQDGNFDAVAEEIANVNEDSIASENNTNTSTNVSEDIEASSVSVQDKPLKEHDSDVNEPSHEDEAIKSTIAEKERTQNESTISPSKNLNKEQEKECDKLIDNEPKESGECDIEEDDGEYVSDEDAMIQDDVDNNKQAFVELQDLPIVVDEVDKMNIKAEPNNDESSDDGELSDDNESEHLPIPEEDSKSSFNKSKSKISSLHSSGNFEGGDLKVGSKSIDSTQSKSLEVKGHKAKEVLLDMHGDELDYEEDVEHGEQQPGHVEEKGEIGEIDDIKEEKKKTSDSELEEGEYDETEDGEIKDDEDEEGELKDPHGRKPFVRQTCRFYQRGQCTWGLSCRFVHPGYNDKGNYMMIGRNEIHNLHASILAPPRPATPPPEEELPRPVIPEEPKIETAWEKGLRHAKELRKKAQIRKEQDEDFEEKRLLAELSDEGDEDYNKENLYRNRDEFYGYHLGEDESPAREVVMKDPTLPQQYAATIHVGRIGKEDVRRGQGQPVTQRNYDFFPKKRDDNYSRQEKIHSNDARNKIEPKAPLVNRSTADSWHDPWARARSPKKVAGARGRRRHSSHSSFTSSSSSRSRSSSYSSYSSRSRSSSSSFSSRSRSGSRSSRSYSKSRSRTPSPRSRSSAWQSSKQPNRSGPSSNNNVPVRGRQMNRGHQPSRGNQPNRGAPTGGSGGLPARPAQSKSVPSKSQAQVSTKPSVSQTSKPPATKPTQVKKVEPVVLKLKTSSQTKKLSIPPIHFQKQIKKVQPIADHLRPSKERSLSSSSRSSRSSRSSSSRSRSRSRSFSGSRSRSQSYSTISSRSRSPVSRASSVSADSEHMYANLASPVSSASSDISDTPIPKATKVKPVKISITKKSVVPTKRSSTVATKTKQGIVKAKPSGSKQKDTVKQSAAKPVSNQLKKALPKSKAIKPLPDSQSSTTTKKTAKVTPMPATSSTNKSLQKSKQPAVSKTSGTSSAAISHDRSDPLKYTAHKDIKLTLLKKPTETSSKKRSLETSTQSIAKKTKPPSPATKHKGTKEVIKKSVPTAKTKVTSSSANPSTKAANVAQTKAQEKQSEKPAAAPAQSKAAVTKKGTKSRREELLKQLKEVEEAIARKRAKLAGT
ncbi:uncharacterized protein [Antedon mediterranea]|uniref:uncharacterized protein n=1 Tax=Antedon mediterranea TaxID=105859 RepID=UPI003AF65E27